MRHRLQTSEKISTGSPAAMWRAIQARDRRADGQFVYAVRSTGIYCRPSCPSRKPGREHVSFFLLPQAAEGKGFRPCLRCWPRAARIADPRVEAVAQICRKIESHISGGAEGDNSGVTLARLAAGSGMAAHQLDRAFRRLIGITPRQYADAQRMLRLKSQLKKGDNVTTALYDAGFGSSSRLYERAPSQLGMTPATYREGGAEMRIHYTIADSTLGRLLVAVTSRGISALYLGESDGRLEGALRKEYPRAEICEGEDESKNLHGWVRRIVDHLRGQEPSLDLPTDVQATAFQRRVWEELRRIPYGSTRTYTQIARAVGKPKAIRAVARACARNPVSVVVPCHRVVRQDGSLAGYRWGIDRKRKLINHETAVLESQMGRRRKDLSSKRG
jgi:AraC family transcriptional regulator of adaptative response/methylated-DNA-[protein]-cysteine methyltransferase